jgi:hypothetical protein
VDPEDAEKVLEGRGSGRFVVGRAVVDAMMVVTMVVMRGGECRCAEGEHAGEEEELLHGYEDGTNGCRLSAEFCLRIREAIQRKGYCRKKGSRTERQGRERMERGA